MFHYRWLFPFVCFFLGYQVLHYVTDVPEFATPKLVGLSMTEAVQLLSDCNLNARIIAQNEEPDLSEGTVLQQTPAADNMIKQNQPVFLVISKKPPRLPAPNMIGKSQSEVRELANELGIRTKIYRLTTHHPRDICIGQIPVPGTLLDTKKISLYTSAGNDTLFLLPNFKQIPISEVCDFLRDYTVDLKITHRQQPHINHQCGSCVVVDQQPLPGSLVNLGDKFSLQLQIEA